ncbi:MAG TPA: TolC family protein [Candidatus Methylacidiphilales bacterium]
MKNRSLLLLALLGALVPARADVPPPPLTLAAAEAQAVATHPLVAAAEARSLEAKAAEREAASALYPQVGAEALAVGVKDNQSQIAAAGGAGLGASSVYSRQSDGLYASWLLTDFGKTWALKSGAAHAALARKAEAEAVRLRVLREVDRAYFGVLRAQAIVRVAEGTVSARKLVYDRASALAQGNLKSSLDVGFAEVDLNRARLLELEARNGLDEAWAQLGNALGRRDAPVFALEEPPLGGPPEESLAPLLDKAFRDRPDLASLREAWESVKKEAAAARAERYPTIEALGNAGVSPIRDNERLAGDYAAAGIAFSLPLFDGGKITAHEAEARYRETEAQRRMESGENDAARDLRTAWLRATGAYREIAVTQDLLASATKAASLAQSRYTAGISSIVELSQAQLEETEAGISAASARYVYLTLKADLKYETGG